MLEWLITKRAQLAIWLYNRYIVEPYIKEQARQARNLAHLLGDAIEIVGEPEQPTIH